MPENDTKTTPASTEAIPAEKSASVSADAPEEATPESAELARLKAENARQKAAMDKAASEAAEYKKQLRAKQSAEEQAAAEAEERQKAIEEELAALRKEKAMALISKKAFAVVGDEKVSAEMAECLCGAEDPEGALDAFSKAWTAKEKALRAEFGKIASPAAGSVDGDQPDKGVELARKRAQARSGVNRNFADVMSFYK